MHFDNSETKPMAKMRKNLNIHLLIIDPQNDFMDEQGAALPVPGATADMQRVAGLIDRIGGKLSDIHVTLDSHRVIDVAHPGMWRNKDGKSPDPFTIITPDDIRNSIWAPRNPNFRARLLTYAETLEVQGKYQLMVWPEHCLIGTPGHNVQADLMEALQRWERDEFANVNYVTKGTNTFTEHYGPLMAEVPDPEDPSTQLNTKVVDILQDADMVVVAGEALSHCVKSGVDQIAENIGEEHIGKFYILTDGSSPVPKVGDGPDFPAIAQQWLLEMEQRGMHLTTTDTFLV
jgi:nicotinamidase/pyrazinamidase